MDPMGLTNMYVFLRKRRQRKNVAKKTLRVYFHRWYSLEVTEALCAESCAKTGEKTSKVGDTVDGRNPAPVDKWFIPLFTGFFYIPGGCLGFLPSTVCRLPSFGSSSLGFVFVGDFFQRVVL